MKHCDFPPLDLFALVLKSRKKPKTLSGIETWLDETEVDAIAPAGKNLKPYQGLKHKIGRATLGKQKAGKNLKPYQGLKPVLYLFKIEQSQAPEKT